MSYTGKDQLNRNPPEGRRPLPKEMMLNRLRGLTQEAGSQKELAARLGVTQSWLSQVMSGLKAPSDALLRELGLEARIMYFHTDAEPPKRVPEAEVPGKLEFFRGQLREVKDATRTGWWRFHEHYDRDGYCDSPARGY